MLEMAKGRVWGGGPGGGRKHVETPNPKLNTPAWEGVPERLESIMDFLVY